MATVYGLPDRSMSSGRGAPTPKKPDPKKASVIPAKAGTPAKKPPFGVAKRGDPRRLPAKGG